MVSIDIWRSQVMYEMPPQAWVFVGLRKLNTNARLLSSNDKSAAFSSPSEPDWASESPLWIPHASNSSSHRVSSMAWRFAQYASTFDPHDTLENSFTWFTGLRRDLTARSSWKEVQRWQTKGVTARKSLTAAITSATNPLGYSLSKTVPDLRWRRGAKIWMMNFESRWPLGYYNNSNSSIPAGIQVKMRPAW